MSPLYRAIVKSMGGKYLAYAIQLASLMLLARWFPPATFGVVAAVQVFYIFFQLIAEGGLGPAVIGLRKLESSDRDGIFGLTLAAGVILGLVLLCLAPVLAAFYGMPQLQDAVPYIAAGLTLNACGILPTALLLRQQAFFKLATASAAAECVSLLVIYAAKDQLDPLHALSLRLPIVSLVAFALTYTFSKATDFGRPAPGLRFVAIKPLLKVSGYQLAFNVLNFFSRNLDNVLVGKYLGASLLGVYDRSYQLMRYPLQLLTFAMTPAIQPVLRDHSDNPGMVREAHDNLTFRISLLGLASAAAMYLLADKIVLLLFGDQWADAVPVIKILALTIPVQVVLSTSGAFFQTFQRTDLLFRCGVFSAFTNVVAITIGVAQGSLEHLCWALLVSFHINFFQAYFTLYRHVFRGGLKHFLQRMIAAATGVVALLTWHFAHAPTL